MPFGDREFIKKDNISFKFKNVETIEDELTFKILPIKKRNNQPDKEIDVSGQNGSLTVSMHKKIKFMLSQRRIIKTIQIPDIEWIEIPQGEFYFK